MPTYLDSCEDFWVNWLFPSPTALLVELLDLFDSPPILLRATWPRVERSDRVPSD